MKKSKILLFGLLVITLLIPFIASAKAADIPGYVGVKAGQTYVWDTEFDGGPYEDYYEAFGITDKDLLENYAFIRMEWHEWEEEVTQWKLNIYDISEGKDEDITAPGASIADEYQYVRIDYTLKEYDGDVGYWRRIESYETGHLWESDEEFWGKLLLDFEEGIYFASSNGKGDNNYPALIVPNDLDWDQVARVMVDQYKYGSKEDAYTADEVEIQYFLGDKDVGIKTEYDPAFIWPQFEDELETFESISKYNDDGVLYYYEFTYDGDIIAKFELKGMLGYNTFITENWWWMAIVAGAACVGVIILICVIKGKRK